MKKSAAQPFTWPIIMVIVLLYAIAGVIVAWQVGPWTAVRQVIINGLIVLAWLWSAHKILADEAIPALPPIRQPAAELVYGFAIWCLAVAFAALWYAGVTWVPPTSVPVLMVGGVLALFLIRRYPPSALGLTKPTRRGWLAVTAVILVNFAAGALFQILPRDVQEASYAGDMAQQITGIGSVVLILLGLLLKAAIPEELLLRVTLQPRLAQFVSLGWAILLQAALFSTAHLPQHLIGYQEPPLLALASLLPLDNGLIAGYLWHRTRSLPLLLLAHLFAFPRFGI